jgi:hypothetical protein
MKLAAAPRSRLVCQSVSRSMKGSCLPSIVQSAVGRNFEIPLLPITSIPATMELAMPGAIDDFVD